MSLAFAEQETVMDIAHLTMQSKDNAALYNEAHRIRREALRHAVRSFVDALRNLVAFASGRTAH